MGRFVGSGVVVGVQSWYWGPWDKYGGPVAVRGGSWAVMGVFWAVVGVLGSCGGSEQLWGGLGSL